MKEKKRGQELVFLQGSRQMEKKKASTCAIDKSQHLPLFIINSKGIPKEKCLGIRRAKSGEIQSWW